MINIYYFFRRPVLNELALAQKGKYPNDYFYGYNKLKGYQTITSDFSENNKFVKFLHAWINGFITNKFVLSFSVIGVVLQFPKFFKAQILFATVDSYGVALAGFKKVSLIRNKKVVFNTIGLCDVLDQNANLIPFYASILSTVDLFISGASQLECKKLSQLLGYSQNKFKFIPFGIDTNYFSPQKIKEDNYILIIGADRKRDWNLYRKLFSTFSKNKFVVITHPNLIPYTLPHNVRVYYNQYIEKVREFIARSKFSVILSKQNYHFAGQSTAFRIMSMGKPVIFTKSYGVEEYGFKNGINSILTTPGDFIGLKKSFILLDSNRKLREKVGLNARNKILKDLSLKQYTRKLENSLDLINQ